MSYYKILGLSKDANENDIKKSYRNLVRTTHPDKGGNKEEFQKIQEAYETLSDPQKKQEYDNPMSSHSNPFEFNHPFFNMNIRSPSQSKKKDHVYNCKIALKDVFLGCIKKLKVERKKVCKLCVLNCSTCNGSGIINENVRMGPFVQIVNKTCGMCNSLGKNMNNYNKSCNECNGTNYVSESNTFEINIEKNINTGKSFEFKGWGEQAIRESDISGSFIVVINIEDDPNFKRDRLNLKYNVNISLKESIIGKKIIVPYFENDFELDTKGFGLINPNKEYVVFNKGMVDKDGKIGNLHIRFVIEYKDHNFSDSDLSLLKKTFENINF